MISHEELNILCEEQTREAIELNIERKHSDVALDKSLCHSSLIATQVKYLQRARTKLPSYYEARCVIPSLAFEQSSSEATAAMKHIEGASVLELTCGLGVDAVALSRRFGRVVTLERDPILAEVARENMRRLGVSNVEVVCCAAEEYLAGCEERFDWIYVDPDRRGEGGRKSVLLEDCSPNVLAVMADIERVADRLAIKCSPMFDVDEAFRLFPRSSVEVVSVGDECKELVIYVGGREGEIGATAVGRGSLWVSRESEMVSLPESFDSEEYRYLLIPDVAMQKGRLARRMLSEVCDIWSNNGFGFAREDRRTADRHIARCEAIEWIGEYSPKRLRRELAERGITRAEVFKREFSIPTDRILKQLGIKEGGARRIALTTICNKQIIIILAQ